MKYCHIALVGFNSDWIIKGTLSFKTDKLILICSNDGEYLQKAEDIKNRLGSQFKDSQTHSSILPEIEIKKVDSRDAISFVRTLKSIILNLGEEWSANINITSGLTSWQLLAYFSAMQLRDKINSLYIIIKDTGEAMNLPLESLTDAETKIISCIEDAGSSLSEIKNRYLKQSSKSSISDALISKYLSGLITKNLIFSKREGKNKIFVPTEIGKIYILG